MKVHLIFLIYFISYIQFQFILLISFWMGSGGSTTHNVVYQAIQDKVDGGEYRDVHINNVQSVVHKNIAFDKIDQILLNHKIPKEKLIEVQKLKFSIKGQIQNLQFILQESFFHGALFQVSTTKLQNGNFDISLNKYKIIAIYEVPTLIHHCISNNVKIQHRMVRSLSNKEQEVIIQSIKGVLQKIKQSNLKSYSGKLTIYDMVKNSIVYSRKDFFFYYFEWISNDQEFLNYLRKIKQNKLADLIQNANINQVKEIHNKPYLKIDNKFMLKVSEALADSVLNAFRDKNNVEFVKIVNGSKKIQDLSKVYQQLAKIPQNQKLMSVGVWHFISSRFCLPTLPTSDANYNAVYKQSLKTWNGYFPMVDGFDMFKYLIGYYDEYGKNILKNK